jgi:uncharacterized protein (DUF4415 family)
VIRGDEFPNPVPGSRIAAWAGKRAVTKEDVEEIPTLPPRVWRQALKTEQARKKKQLTVRLDADIFDWLKGLGPGYHTKLNAMLRSAMKAVSA